jgi:hypothetical protein
MFSHRVRSLRLCFRVSSIFSRVSVFVLLTLLGVPSVVCQSQELTPTEKRAITQIAQGDSGDFSGHTPVVDGAFVQKLLSGGFKSNDPSHSMDVHGIKISNAVFPEELDIDFEVPYRVTFDHCHFEQGLDFSGSQFDKDLVFDHSTFGTSTSYPLKDSDKDSPPGVRFINATVNGTVSIQSGDFYIPIDFTKAHVKELDIEDALFESADQDDPDLDVSALSVSSDLSLSVRAAQPRKVEAQLLNVGRLASFGRTVTGFFATNEFFLADARFQKITVYEFEQWKANAVKGALTLDGISFRELSLSSNGKVRKAAAMLELLDSEQSIYGPQPYLALEQNLSTNGDQDGADSVYIHMRERQRIRIMSWVARTTDWVLEWLIGYGREPGRAVWWTLGFVALGMLIFSPRHMVPQDDEGDDSGEKNNATYSRFWYSLDVLAPAIELGADKAWQPNPNWWFGRTYAYIHRIVGWILVPLILAALTGVIH